MGSTQAWSCPQTLPAPAPADQSCGAVPKPSLPLLTRAVQLSPNPPCRPELWSCPQPLPTPADHRCGAVPNPSMPLLTRAFIGTGKSQPGFGKDQNRITAFAQSCWCCSLQNRKSNYQIKESGCGRDLRRIRLINLQISPPSGFPNMQVFYSKLCFSKVNF